MNIMSMMVYKLHVFLWFNWHAVSNCNLQLNNNGNGDATNSAQLRCGSFDRDQTHIQQV